MARLVGIRPGGPMTGQTSIFSAVAAKREPTGADASFAPNASPEFAGTLGDYPDSDG